MTEREDFGQDPQTEVGLELQHAGDFAKTLRLEEFRSGEWFVTLMQQVVRAYDRNARAEYFQQKYVGLPADDIADTLVSVAVRYAAIAGGLTGAAVTANQFIAIPAGGATLVLMTGAIGAEMIGLSRIQMRLVLDLATVYDQELDIDDPEDMLMLFGYALGAAPMETAGKVAQRAAAYGTQTAVKKFVSKSTLKTIQDFGRRLGFRILQRTFIKYGVPLASVAVGSSYNYISTKSLGSIAKAHMKNRGRAAVEIRGLMAKQTMHAVAFPAALMSMAEADGTLIPREKELYRAILAQLSSGEHDLETFDQLFRDRSLLLDALAAVEDPNLRSGMLEALALMAVYDGDLNAAEADFLSAISERFDLQVDLKDLERRAQGYKIGASDNILTRTSDAAKHAAGLGSVAVTAMGARARRSSSRLLRRSQDPSGLPPEQ